MYRQQTDKVTGASVVGQLVAPSGPVFQLAIFQLAGPVFPVPYLRYVASRQFIHDGQTDNRV